MTPEPPPPRDKPALRARARALLRDLSPSRRAAASLAIARRLTELPALAHARLVMAYLARPDEVDLDPFIRRRLDLDLPTAVPHVDWDRRAMQPARLAPTRSGGPLHLQVAPGENDIRTVRNPSLIAGLDERDAILIPALAFDLRGGRLGRGGGFYDRFLDDPGARHARRIGIAFETQVLHPHAIPGVDRLPLEPHDACVDLIVTDARVIDCRSRHPADGGRERALGPMSDDGTRPPPRDPTSGGDARGE